MLLVDFHTHSNNSDGTNCIAELLSMAEKRELLILSISDHDNIMGQSEALRLSEGMTLKYVTGVEISCESDNTLHMPRYAFD